MSVALGGGTSAVAASTHAACARFRGTDPMITGRARRTLASDLGKPDTGAGIPEARWMRAMVFERLVRDERFASQIATRAVGDLGLERPASVVIRNARTDVAVTVAELQAAHDRAVENSAATLIHRAAVPFPGFEDADATAVLPDFIVVAPKIAPETGSWLVAGDAKDYERVRSRIDDQRMLKGYLQVALGAESFDVWSKRPAGMNVHSHGVLAVPRNAFLQPLAVVEDLTDHREEVRMRVAQRHAEAAGVAIADEQPVDDLVAHLMATYDPATCPSCPLFTYCRDELRASSNPLDLLVEIGVPANERPLVAGLVDGTGEINDRATPTTVALVAATVTGVAQSTGQRRVDPIGLPGTMNVVVAKSDAAALGVYGVSVQRVTENGATEWSTTLFADPQSDATRRGLMKVIGDELLKVMKHQFQVAAATGDPELPVHVVVPDQPTADLLASIADVLAGVEISRLRWERDIEVGRPALTFDGEPATVPPRLLGAARTAVSFFLEEDRARALTLRTPVVSAQRALSEHLVAGGPASNSGRLDYLVEWVEATEPLDHRVVADAVERSRFTPGARLSVGSSDSIHRAHVGERGQENANPDEYDRLVRDELAFEQDVLGRAITVLDAVPESALRPYHRAIEGDAQAIWRRRLDSQASDLVRFGRTYRFWRNNLVPAIEDDERVRTLLTLLANPHAAAEFAADAGNKQLAVARVVSVVPLTLDVKSRRIGAGDTIVLLHRNGDAAVESGVQVDGARLRGMSFGPLDRDPADDGTPTTVLRWNPATVPVLAVGDELIVSVVADKWFEEMRRPVCIRVPRPTGDSTAAPKPTCQPDDFANAPADHQWCCKPHKVAEAEFSDEIALRRQRGELNPQTWPPIRDADSFDVAPTGSETATPSAEGPAPDHLTIDELD